MDLGLSGKWALVMGSSSGIGLAIAEQLVLEGASVVVASRSAEKLGKAVAYLAPKNPSVVVESQMVDLTQESSIRAMWGKVANKPIQIVVNNVGGPATGNSVEIGLEQWDRGFQSLLRSVILVSQLAVPGMKERNWGRILTVTSTSAREMIPGLPVSGVFRAGLSAWVKSFAKDVGRWSILANNLLPGPTNTERLSELSTKSPQFFNSMRDETAVKRVAEPEEIARVAAFLCSNANTYVTGTDILADGGYTKAL